MNTNPTIAILLATYNGEKYLAEQLDSILAQTYSNFLIVVRDDVSKDGSVGLIRDYADRNPEKFHIVDNGGRNLGASACFSSLIEYVLQNKTTLGLNSAYMMFCDQDDIWFETKLAQQLQAMLQAENTDSGSEVLPILIHSDLEVVSDRNEVIAKSFIKFQGLAVERNRFPNLVISNLVTGCTAFINEALARKAVPVPENAIMHDWWLALVASAFGKLIFLDTPLVHYRQHENNTIGAKEFVKLEPIGSSNRAFWRRLLTPEPNEHLFEVATQAIEFRERFGEQLSGHDRRGLKVSSWMKSRRGLVQRLSYRIARHF